MTEPTKVCPRCTTRKPWSQFGAKTKWEDGSIRQPQSYCGPCKTEYNKNSPWRSDVNKRYWAKFSKSDRYQDHLERRRFRENKGSRPRNIDIGPAARLLIEPFSRWLRETFDDPGDAARVTGLDDSAMRRYFHGKQPYVSIDTVDRACIAMGIRIDDLYA